MKCLFVMTAGNWNNGSDAGVFNRNWNNNRTNNSNNVSFRASDYLSIPDIPTGKTGDIGSVRPATRRNPRASAFQYQQGPSTCLNA